MESANCLGNSSGAAEFHILGFQISPSVKPFIFLFFLTIYIATETMNVLIITTISTNEHLRTPMFYFLVNLSVLDMCYPSTVILTILGSLVGKFIISLVGCSTQFFFEAWLACNECFLLAVMAYDRYVAICYPLHYMTIMSRGRCINLVIVAWLLSFCYGFSGTLSTFTLQFSGLNEINHFFCDFAPLLKSACSDISVPAIEVFITALIITIIPVILIIASYVFIISAILRIPSANGRLRAFSTCSSHLTVVIAFFGALIIIYGTPTTGYSLTVNKIASMVYTVATPLFNPIIYTLRNKEISDALKKTFLTKV